MYVHGINIPDKPLTNIELVSYASELKIPHFRGVFMRDTIPKHPRNIECGILNFNTSNQSGSHWVCYYKGDKNRIYFDSYGQVTPIEIQHYLKTSEEFKDSKQVIKRNTDIVQAPGTSVCGHLCLHVLKSLPTNSFQTVLNHMRHYGYP